MEILVKCPIIEKWNRYLQHKTILNDRSRKWWWDDVRQDLGRCTIHNFIEIFRFWNIGKSGRAPCRKRIFLLNCSAEEEEEGKKAEEEEEEGKKAEEEEEEEEEEEGILKFSDGS